MTRAVSITKVLLNVQLFHKDFDWSLMDKVCYDTNEVHDGSMDLDPKEKKVILYQSCSDCYLKKHLLYIKVVGNIVIIKFIVYDMW